MSRAESLVMKLPIPVSVNKLYYNTKGGGKRLTSEAERYTRNTRALVHMYMEEQDWEKHDKDTWYYLDLNFTFPDRRIRDSHNCLKLLLDVLQGVCFNNDYYVLPRIQNVEIVKGEAFVMCKLFKK